MFRWLKDKRKNKDGDRKTTGVEDDYGFRKKGILVQEGKQPSDEAVTKVKSRKHGSHARARMPTPVIPVNETSSHIYDEIRDSPLPRPTDLDLLKDTRRQPINLRNAVEVGPYLIVQICDPEKSKTEVEIFRREPWTSHDRDDDDANNDNDVTPAKKSVSKGDQPLSEYSPPWDLKKTPKQSKVELSNADILKDAKIVLTRCVKTRSTLQQLDLAQQNSMCSSQPSSPKDEEVPMCSNSIKPDFDSGSLAESSSRTLTGTPEVDDSSNSRTLTGTPDSHDQSEPDEGSCECRLFPEADGNDSCYEYDISTSGESDLSERSTDYELYLSKIESNLKHKRNVKRILDNLPDTIDESENDECCDFLLETSEIDSMTYVSSLSEYSSARSQFSDEVSDLDCVADQSTSDDSSGYYECQEEKQGQQLHIIPVDTENAETARVNLERSVSAPNGKSTNSSTKFESKKYREKFLQKLKKSQNRSKSFDCSVYTTRSTEDQEMYLLPVDKRSSSNTSGSRSNRNKSVLTPQPTPVYMDPYRGKAGNHNRLLGDLIRMNYNKQLLLKM